MSNNIATIEDPESLSPVELWGAEITAAEAELKKFYERGRMVTRRFLDERDTMSSQVKWFNIFYANTNILTSALYAQLPKPAVSRKYTDYQDEVARVGALILERCITQDLDDPTDTFDATMRAAVQDRLVPGLAQAWLRLETDTEEISVPPTPGNDVETPGEQELATEKPGLEGEIAPPPQKVTDQRICVDYIFWQDFLWSPCRVWEERRWVARKAYMTREELIERFGEEKGKKCPLNYTSMAIGESNQPSTPKEDVLKKAIVYEIWDRTTRKVFWYAKGMDELLDEKEDFLKLKGFEPCPRPMLANVSTSNTVPRPDYYMLQDQYTELDTINNRISMLIQACKVVGVYDQTMKGISRMLQEGFDNQLIPVDNWAMFADKGGLKGTVDWLPLESVIAALRELNDARERIKAQIYELTGISDIVRGASKASETLGAQQIKSQFASIRIKKLQDEVARFASDIMRIKGELMVKHFTPEMLVAKSNVTMTGDVEYVPAAIQMLKSDTGFEWRIQVNSDTMSQADYAMEKQDRIDFMTAISKFFQQVGPMLEASPDAAPVMIGLLKWTVAGFRGVRDIEGMLDKALDGMLKQPPQDKPDPAAQQQQMEQQKMQQQAQLDQQKAQQEMALKAQQQQLDQQKAQQEMQAEQMRLRMEIMAEQQRLQLEQQKQAAELQFTRLMEAIKLHSAQALADVKLQAAEATAKAAASAPAQKASK